MQHFESPAEKHFNALFLNGLKLSVNGYRSFQFDGLASSFSPTYRETADVCHYCTLILSVCDMND